MLSAEIRRNYRIGIECFHQRDAGNPARSIAQRTILENSAMGDFVARAAVQNEFALFRAVGDVREPGGRGCSKARITGRCDRKVEGPTGRRNGLLHGLKPGMMNA